MPLIQGASPIGRYLEEQFTKTLPKLYEVKYDENWGLNPAKSFQSAIPDLPIGLDAFDAYSITDGGQMAAIYDGMSDDIPIVEVALGKLPPIKCVPFIMGAKWNEFDLEREKTAKAAKVNVPTINIVTAKQQKIGDYFNRREHHTALYGLPKRDIFGIFSVKGIAVQDNTFAPYVKAAGDYTVTTEQLYEDLVDLIYFFINKAKLSEVNQIQMKVPLKLARRLVEYKNPQTNTTIMQLLKSEEVGLGISSIEFHAELQGENLNKHVINDSGTAYYPTTNDRIVLKATTWTPERHYSTRRTKPIRELSNLNYQVITYGASSGIIDYDAYENMMYYDFSNADT